MNEEAKCDPTAKVSARVATDQVVDKYLKEIMPEINRAIDEKRFSAAFGYADALVAYSMSSTLYDLGYQTMVSAKVGPGGNIEYTLTVSWAPTVFHTVIAGK